MRRLAEAARLKGQHVQVEAGRLRANMSQGFGLLACHHVPMQDASAGDVRRRTLHF